MTYREPAGPSAFGRWPITGDVKPAGRPPSADPVAAVLLIVAGLAGVVQLFVPWIGIGGGLPGGYTGWQLFKIGRDQSLDFSGTVATWTVPSVAIAGGALILLGLALLAPINHRPLGAVGLVFSVAALVAGLWWILETRAGRGGLGAIVDLADIGWYLFLATGLVGVVGSIKAIATG